MYLKPLVSSLLVLSLFSCALRPSPLTLAEHQQRVAEDKSKLYANQEPLTGELTLEMAIARALKYNYDHRLSIMEAAFHDQQLTAATYSMLPKLAGNAGYSNRSNEAASSSISYRTRQQTLEPSVSSQEEGRTADLSITWTLLDFGLSYFEAKQQADRVLIMQERKRRVVNNMVKEVIDAYWKTLTAERLIPLVDKALEDATTALASYTKIQEENLSSPLETLEQHRDLLSIVAQLRHIRADLAMSHIKLAALINVPLGTPFTLATPDKRLLTPPPLKLSLEELEDKGLALRPDLREEAYQERIDKTEVHKEILRMMPGVSLFAGYNYDANKFLVNNEWSELGARATMSLFNLVTGPMQIKAANTKVEVTRTRRLAQTVAALVQINISYYQYKQALEDYTYSKEINGLEKKILNIVQSENTLNAQSKLGLIRRSISAVRTQIDHDRAFSDIYMYWSNMYFSLGGDIAPQHFENEALPAMSQDIQKQMEIWWSGELPFNKEPLAQNKPQAVPASSPKAN